MDCYSGESILETRRAEGSRIMATETNPEQQQFRQSSREASSSKLQFHECASEFHRDLLEVGDYMAPTAQAATSRRMGALLMLP